MERVWLTAFRTAKLIGIRTFRSRLWCLLFPLGFVKHRDEGHSADQGATVHHINLVVQEVTGSHLKGAIDLRYPFAQLAIEHVVAGDRSGELWGALKDEALDPSVVEVESPVLDRDPQDHFTDVPPAQGDVVFVLGRVERRDDRVVLDRIQPVPGIVPAQREILREEVVRPEREALRGDLLRRVSGDPVDLGGVQVHLVRRW